MERIYRLLILLLYPRSFREEYEADLLRAFQERRGEIGPEGLRGQLRFAGFMLADLARSAILVRFRGGRTKDSGAGRNDEGRTTMKGLRMSQLTQDLRFALRSYRRRPGFFLAAGVTLALAVGASTAVFSVVDGVLLRPLPYEDPHELVQIGTTYQGYDGLASTSPPDFFDWRERAKTIELMAASRLENLTLLEGAEPATLQGAGVSAEYFDLLGVEPSWGRGFTPAEDTPGAEAVGVLSHGAWQRLWGGDPDVLGHRLRFDGLALTVAGVMPPDFHPPEAIYHENVEIWFPLAHVSDPLHERGSAFLQILGRLREGTSLHTAREELETVARAVATEHPLSVERSARMEPLHARTVAGVNDSFDLVVGAVALLLLIGCANVANLFLVRATERRQEMAVRASLGAGRRRLSTQLLVEALVLTLTAGVAGVAVAHAGVEGFRLFGPEGVPRLDEVGITGRVLAFTLLLSTATGIGFGLAPALHLRCARLGETLREGAASVAGGRNHARSVLVVVQTGLAVTLVTGAGLLMNSFVRLSLVNPGFEPQGAAWIAVDLDDDVAEKASSRVAFLRAVEEHLSALPGVLHAGSTTNLPMTPNESRRSVTPEGWESGPGERPPTWSYHVVSPSFFDAMGVPLLRGRTFSPSDDMSGPRVGIVNEALAAHYWPGAEALGKRFKFGGPDDPSPWVTVVGVVGDVKQMDLASREPPHVYLPWAQQPRTRFVTVVRTANPAGILQPMRRAVREVDPTLPLEQFGTMEAKLAQAVVEPRFYALLLTAFGGVAVVLAFVGIYGTMAYSVERRTRELGVRMALGAGHGHVMRLVARRGVALTAVGIGMGLSGALVSSRVLESFVFGITPGDPTTLVAAALGLAAVALLACWLPARRAASLDPAQTLRIE